MKPYTILGLLALLTGCSNEVKDTLSDTKVYVTEAAREITESPSNLNAITDAAHDLRYAHGNRAINNSSRIDFSRNAEPLQDRRTNSALRRDAYNLTKDLDQTLEETDLFIEKVYHAVGLN